MDTDTLAERVRFELTGLSSSGFKVWVRAFADGRGWPFHEGIGRFPGLEFADVRPCCYRLLLPVNATHRPQAAAAGEVVGDLVVDVRQEPVARPLRELLCG